MDSLVNKASSITLRYSLLLSFLLPTIPSIVLSGVVSPKDKIELISVNTADEYSQADRVYFSAPHASSNGNIIAFSSSATNLVSNDNNDKIDVFVRDRAAGTTERVSVFTNGDEIEAKNIIENISADGRYIAFQSRSDSFEDLSCPMTDNLYLHDRNTGITELMNVNPKGSCSNAGAFRGFISDNAQYYVFTTIATNLVEGDESNQYKLILRDRINNTNTIIAARSNALPEYPSIYGNDTFGNVALDISSDGSRIVFTSKDDLTGNPDGEAFDVFVADTNSGVTQIVSRDADAMLRAHYDIKFRAVHFRDASINNNATLIAFTAEAFTQANEWITQSFVFNTDSGETTAVSVDTSGTALGNREYNIVTDISHDGRYVAFVSNSFNISNEHLNDYEQLYIRDLSTGTTTLNSLNAKGEEANEHVHSGKLSRGGRYSVFVSKSSNLLSGPSGASDGIYLRDNLALGADPGLPSSPLDSEDIYPPLIPGLLN